MIKFMYEHGTQTPGSEEQVAQVEGYYHGTIEQLDSTLPSTFGSEATYFDDEHTHPLWTDSNSVRELTCQANRAELVS